MKIIEMMGGKEPKVKMEMLKRVGNLTAFLSTDKKKIQIQNKAGKTLINIAAEDFADFDTVMKVLLNEIK